MTQPSGSIIFQSSNYIENNDPLNNQKADTLLIPTANRSSTEELIKKIIPLHHNNFFIL
jgi:hypothetical protein